MKKLVIGILAHVDAGKTTLSEGILYLSGKIGKFSKQAMERTLQVLDYAILVISGADGVQGHTKTLWSLLDLYQIPVFLFVNKMDQNGTDKDAHQDYRWKTKGERCLEES